MVIIKFWFDGSFTDQMVMVLLIIFYFPDVWLGNARGNAYSTNHTTLKPYGSRKNRRKFWSFSWHEIGYYDVPASIDYVLAKTNQTKLQYIGHSQGATAFFIMASERPQYNDKIEMMHALAPGVLMSHIRSPLIRAILPFLSILEVYVRTKICYSLFALF